MVKYLLSKGMKKYVLSEDKSGYDKGTQNTYNYRLRIDVREAIEDLTMILQKLPESELEGLFNDRTMAPFFEALFKVQINAKDHEEWIQKKHSKEIRVKRQRLFRLSKRLLDIISKGSFVSTILPESSKHHLGDKIGIDEKNLIEMFKIDRNALQYDENFAKKQKEE